MVSAEVCGVRGGQPGGHRQGSEPVGCKEDGAALGPKSTPAGASGKLLTLELRTGGNPALRALAGVVRASDQSTRARA